MYRESNADITNPGLQWVGNACYRVFHGGSFQLPEGNESDYNSADYGETDKAEEDDEEYTVEISPEGKFFTSLHVAKRLIKYVVGSHGANKRDFEQTTKTKLSIPTDDSGLIKITGDNKRDVLSAVVRLEVFLLKKRESHPATHFLAIPVNNDEIKINYNKFMKTLMTDRSIVGLNDKLFQNGQKLHLTICVFTILDDEEENALIAAAKECEATVIKPLSKKLKTRNARIAGIEYMNDDPSEVDVLYGKICFRDEDQTNAFQYLVNEIQKFFLTKEFTKRQYDSVKLHCTLMNTSFRRKTEDNASDKMTFNVAPIMGKHLNFDFGKVVLDTVSVCTRFKNRPDGFYFTLCDLKI